MKKIFKISLLALFLGTVSCDDATDIVQANELQEENAYRTLGDLQTGLNGVYATYRPESGSNGSGEAFLFNALFTDNLKRGESNSGQGSQMYSFALQPGSSFPTAIWGNRYAMINYSNRLLRGWENLFPTIEEEDIVTANQIKAQALTLRALGHFDLLQYFTEDYQNLSAPSIILMDFVPELGQVFPRSTVGEAYEFIENDLTEAADLIGDFYPADEGGFEAYYINADVIKAIQVRVALVKGDYSLAGSLIVDLENTGNYDIASTSDYQAMYMEDQITSENIWTLARKTDDSEAAAMFYTNQPNKDGSPFYELSYDLYESFESSDIRRQVILQQDSDVSDDLLLIGKYPGGPFGLLVNDVKLIRWAEMLLIRAEISARSGDLAGAAQVIQFLRNRRYQLTAPTVSYSSTTEALNDILLERRKELAFEGHRYLDLKRFGKGIDRDNRDCESFSAPCGLPAGDYRFTMPIPTSEVNANPTIQQNANYN